MQSRIKQFALLMMLGSVITTSLGCAEGMLWRTGQYAPWVRKTWQEEEQIATTLFTRKQQMADAVSAVQNGADSQKNEVAQQLNEVIFRDPVVLLRLHAVDLLSQLDCEESMNSLAAATKDRSSEIRIAAVKSLSQQTSSGVIPILQEVIGSDTNGDVRLAATEAIGAFSSAQSLNALALVIEDKDPALQVVAIESLRKVTGQNFGPDVFAWKEYLATQNLNLGQTSVAEQVDQLQLPENLRR